MEAKMKKISRIALSFTGAVLCISSAIASNQPTTFLGPTLRGAYTAPLSNMTAYSLAGEAGVQNFRLAATLGFRIDEIQRFKVTGEYLWQRLNDGFFSGNTRQWLNQGALDLRYEYDFDGYSHNPQFDLSGFYSHAPSNSMSSRSGVVTTAGVATPFVNVRRIAGSETGGVSPGFSVGAWQGGRVGIDANYDNVSYDNINTNNHDAKGWGGTIYLRQVLGNNLVMGASAANRKPFNDYEVNFDLTNVQYYGRWTLGINGDYLVGKNTLANSWNLGLSADFFMDPLVAVPNLKGENNLKGEIAEPVRDNLLYWIADPAVHMPQVLAIADGR
jgi:hypothetical protein